MSTVVSRLNEAIATTPGPRAMVRGIALTMSDAVALDKLIASLCEAETACEFCDTRLCEECQVGDRTDTVECAQVHCDDCAGECRTCVDAMSDDAGRPLTAVRL